MVTMTVPPCEGKFAPNRGRMAIRHVTEKKRATCCKVALNHREHVMLETRNRLARSSPLTARMAIRIDTEPRANAILEMEMKLPFGVGNVQCPDATRESPARQLER
jgi:hypothetical protein